MFKTQIVNLQKRKKVHKALKRTSETYFKGLLNESYTKNYRNTWTEINKK